MYTSANKEANLKLIRNYAIISLALALFGAIYESFSHGVISPFMIFAFAPPLILGAAPALVSHLAGARPMTSPGIKIYRTGIAVLTLGMIFKGVVDIYGTDSPYPACYFIAAAILLLSGAALALIKKNG